MQIKSRQERPIERSLYWTCCYNTGTLQEDVSWLPCKVNQTACLYSWNKLCQTCLHQSWHKQRLCWHKSQVFWWNTRGSVSPVVWVEMASWSSRVHKACEGKMSSESSLLGNIFKSWSHAFSSKWTGACMKTVQLLGWQEVRTQSNQGPTEMSIN
jgi:hypothetical protein